MNIKQLSAQLRHAADVLDALVAPALKARGSAAAAKAIKKDIHGRKHLHWTQTPAGRKKLAAKAAAWRRAKQAEKKAAW
jgi:hypothetical protein